MSRTIRFAVLSFAVAAISACSSSVTEPTAPKCTANSKTVPQSCASLDYINPVV